MLGDTQLMVRSIRLAERVHRTLGPGFVESIYSRALVAEFQREEFLVEREKLIRIRYGNLVVGRHRLDLVINQRVILELKVSRTIIPVHVEQLRSYLHATDYPIGLIINFGMPSLQWERVERKQ